MAGRLLLWCRAGAPSASSHSSGLGLLDLLVHCTFLPELITLLANVESDRSQLLAVSCCGVSYCGYWVEQSRVRRAARTARAGRCQLGSSCTSPWASSACCSRTSSSAATEGWPVLCCGVSCCGAPDRAVRATRITELRPSSPPAVMGVEPRARSCESHHSCRGCVGLTAALRIVSPRLSLDQPRLTCAPPCTALTAVCCAQLGTVLPILPPWHRLLTARVTPDKRTNRPTTTTQQCGRSRRRAGTPRVREGGPPCRRR